MRLWHFFTAQRLKRISCEAISYLQNRTIFVVIFKLVKLSFQNSEASALTVCHVSQTAFEAVCQVFLSLLQLWKYENSSMGLRHDVFWCHPVAAFRVWSSLLMKSQSDSYVWRIDCLYFNCHEPCNLLLIEPFVYSMPPSRGCRKVQSSYNINIEHTERKRNRRAMQRLSYKLIIEDIKRDRMFQKEVPRFQSHQEGNQGYKNGTKVG